MAVSVLPSFAIPLIWKELQLPPVTHSDMDVNARALSNYFETTSISGDFPLSLWSHFDHCGPRTTNFAEGFHNSMNTRFGIPHPSIRSLLDWLQKCQFEIQCREVQLASGRPPKQHLPAYVKMEADIASAKFNYSLQIGRVFAYTFPHPTAWSMFYAATHPYLAYMSHLIGV